MEDRPQEDVRQPEVTYVTFPVYQSPGVKTLMHINASRRLHFPSFPPPRQDREKLRDQQNACHRPAWASAHRLKKQATCRAGGAIHRYATDRLFDPAYTFFCKTMNQPMPLKGQGSPVTTTRSIFQKTCPACMITLALDARECACGHQFDHDDNDPTLSSEAIRLQAEELYENYLAARAEQASSAVMTAQSEHVRDPASAQKSQRIAKLVQEAEEARAALTAQSERVAEMRKALPPAPVRRPVPVPVAAKQNVVEMKKALPPATAPRHAHAPAAPKKKIVLAKPAVTPSPTRAMARTLKNPDTDDAITTSLVSRRAAKKAAAVPAKPRPVPAPVAAKPEAILPPVQTKAPNPAFRQAQAARAEKILRQAETAAAVKAVIKEEIAVVPEIAAAPKSQPKASPAAAPVLAKSAPRLLGGDKKECPNCTASVDNKLNRCRCGFEFPTSESLMPALSMSEEERAEFAKLFRFP